MKERRIEEYKEIKKHGLTERERQKKNKKNKLLGGPGNKILKTVVS